MRSLKRRTLAGLTVVAVSLVACTGQTGGTQRTIGTIALGADLPLSGADGALGTPAKDAVDLATMVVAGSIDLDRLQRTVAATLRKADRKAG